MKGYIHKPAKILLLVFILHTSIAPGQSVTDSLRKVAASAREDTTRAKALNSIAWLLAEENPAQSLEDGFTALQLAQRAGDRFIEADCYKSIGVAYDYKGDLDSCIFYLYQSLAIYRQLNNIIKQSNVLSDIAVGYYARGIYELALKNHFAALELRKQVNDSALLGKSYNNIGLVYKARKDYPKAITYYQQSMQIKKALHDDVGVLNTTINLGSLYQNRSIYDSALLYADSAYRLAVKNDRLSDITSAILNQAMAYNSLKKNEAAFALLKKAELNVIASNSKVYTFVMYVGYGNYYSSKKDHAQSIHYFLKALQCGKTNGHQQETRDAYKLLSETYFVAGDYRLAFLYRDSSDVVDQEMLNKENLRQINEMTAVYETAEKEKQIQQLSIDGKVSERLAEQRKRERNYFILASILFLGLALLVFIAFRLNRKKKNQLNIQNNIIEKSLAEKEVLMKEIHHRVKNNLQVISSLLNLQSTYIKDEQAQDAVKESRNRVQSMALIHQNLYQEENLTGISVADYISKLCDNLFASYNISAQKIKLVKDIQPIILDVDIVVPLGLILNELISNSLKYAFQQTEKEGIIKVSLKEQDNQLKLEVYDNGRGFPADFTNKGNASFGHRMINAFLQKLEGEINLYNEDGARATVLITKYKKSENHE